MPLLLVDNTNLQGLFNRLKALYTLVEDAYNDAADPISGYSARVSFVYQRFRTAPEPNEGTSVDLLGSLNRRYSNVVDFVTNKCSKTLVRMIGDEYKVVDNNVDKSLAFLVMDMVIQNQTVGRAETTISVTPLATNIGQADVIVSDIIPVPGVPGLVDQTGTAKQADKSSYVWNETIAVSVVKPGTVDGPATVVIEGDESRNKRTTYNWTSFGSGVKGFELRSFYVDNQDNLLSNASFEVIADQGPDKWVLGPNVTWGSGNNNVLYFSNVRSTHGLNSIFYNTGNANTTYQIYQTGLRLEPYRVYFVAADVLADGDFSGVILRFSFHDDDTVGSVKNFYNAKFDYVFGTDIPVDATDFTNVRHVVVTDNSIVTDRTYRLAVSIVTPANFTWPSGKRIYIDRMFLVRPVQIYNMGPHIALLSSKKDKALRTGDGWIITVSGNQMEYWNWLFYHIFDISDKKIQLPQSNFPTITKGNVS